MPDTPVPVDGVMPAAPQPQSMPEPSAAKSAAVHAPKSVKTWKGLILIVLGAATALYLCWGLLLIAVLPTSTGELRHLETIGVVSAMAAGVFFLVVGVIGFMRIREAEASVKSRQIAIVKLFLAVIPGIAMSLAMPYFITREPAYALTIASPETQEELVAPLTMTFSAEEAASVMEKRTGFRAVRFRWDIDGDKQFDQETVVPTLSASFDRAGIFTVSVVASNASGESKVASKRFIIQQSVFSIAPNPPIVERPVVFSVAHLVDDANPPTDVQWDFDGDGKTDETVSHPEISFTYYRVGKVKVTAVLSLQNKTQVRLERTIDVQMPAPLPFPVSVVTEPKYLISPPPFPTLFRIDTQENISQVQWNFGDGVRADGDRVAHTFERKGSFPVTAKVWSESGSVAELTTVVRVVDVLNIPDLTFEGTPPVSGNRISKEVPLTLNIKPKTNMPFVTFMWEAPEATEVGSTETTLQAIYRREGTYTITLIAQDSEDRVMRLPIVVEVKPATSFLSFQMSPETGVAPLEVQFDASETFIPNETITGFQWEFGDNTQVIYGGARARHLFSNAGTYTVTLIARTTSGKEFRTTRTIVVRAPLTNACIEPSRTTGTAPLGVGFSMECSSGDIAKVLWDFGDGATSDERSPVHVFEAAGTYKVTLTIEDAGLRQSKHTVTITVR